MSSVSHEHAISMDKASDQTSIPTIISSLNANTKVAPIYNKLKASISETKCKKESSETTQEDRAKTIPKIQKVPQELREQTKFQKLYEPRWISIGPIHHGNPKLKLTEDQYKLELVAKFISESGAGIESLYSKIRDNIHDLKKYFHEDVIKNFDDETLSWMLCLDGCSVLQFINSYVKSELAVSFSIKNEHIAYAQQDLFLMENQIPLAVLKMLMRASNKSEELNNSVKKFVRLNVMSPKKYKKHLEIKMESDPEPAHLLELLRLAIIQPPKPTTPSRCDIQDCFPKKTSSESNEQQSFRSVQDLVTAGIELKPSKTCSLKDISFRSLCFAGWLELPPITVDDLTGSRFLNLIAYEMCPDNFRTNYEVTSYISLLDSLIDYPNDVKELRSAHILHNLLGCDKDVALLFNEIATDLVSSPVYDEVVAKIQNHVKSKWRTWMAQVYHEHFSTPWTIVTFLAAVVALGMSGVQTWYTIYPKNSDDSC